MAVSVDVVDGGFAPEQVVVFNWNAHLFNNAEKPISIWIGVFWRLAALMAWLSLPIH